MRKVSECNYRPPDKNAFENHSFLAKHVVTKKKSPG